MPHRFENAAEWSQVFDSAERDAWQKPDVVVEKLGLQEKEVVADIGAGTGYFAVRIAKRIPAGVVYAVDIEADMERFVRARADKEGLKNLRAVTANANDPMLPEAVDLVLIVDTVHHIEDRNAYFAKVKTKLKPGGRIVIVDFKKEDTPVGPPLEMRLGPDDVIADLKKSGLIQTDIDEQTLPYQYILTFRAGP